MQRTLVLGLLVMISATGLLTGSSQAEGASVQKVLRLPPREGNPRNSEGDFVQLRDGRLLFIYTHFTKGAGDHANAFLAGRYSDNGGQTWTQKDVTIIPNEAKQNVMSVSLLRLRDGRIALFYMRKNSLLDCRPVVRFSTDEAKTWSDATDIIPKSQIGYYVLNNDRAVQLKSGRLIIPVSRHATPHGRWTKASSYGTIMSYCSDDGGHTWRRSKTQRNGSPPKETKGKRIMLQEPGIVELKDGQQTLPPKKDIEPTHSRYWRSLSGMEQSQEHSQESQGQTNAPLPGHFPR